MDGWEIIAIIVVAVAMAFIMYEVSNHDDPPPPWMRGGV